MEHDYRENRIENIDEDSDTPSAATVPRDSPPSVSL
jgi:hypothetical protein